MMTNEYRVDFREKGPGQKRFHKAFTFALAGDPEEAARRIKQVRPGSEVEIISVLKVFGDE